MAQALAIAGSLVPGSSIRAVFGVGVRKVSCGNSAYRTRRRDRLVERLIILQRKGFARSRVVWRGSGSENNPDERWPARLMVQRVTEEPVLL